MRSLKCSCVAAGGQWLSSLGCALKDMLWNNVVTVRLLGIARDALNPGIR